MRITGNPFVDSGIFASKEQLKKDLKEITTSDLKEMASFVSKIYVKGKWQKNMYSIFPNSVLVNPSSAKKGSVEEMYFNTLESYIENISPMSNGGDCISCGARNSVRSFQKSSVPLTGSGSLKNYFSFAKEGADYCHLCALLVQFSPLVIYRSGGKMIILHSNSKKVMEHWARKAIYNIKKQIAKNSYTGCFDEGFTNPNNAIFRIIENIIRSYDERWVDENPSLNLYYFTNYNQGPELEIFSIPSNVFRFLAGIGPDEDSNWTFIVKKAYKYVKWDKIKSFEDYKNNPNEVYNRLLKNASILRFFFNTKDKKAFCSWNLLSYYMQEVRDMDKERLNVIKGLGDKLSDFIKESDEKKILSHLENSSNYNTFRNVLRKIIKKRIANKNRELLFTFEEYSDFLFPEGNLTWRETQDLLLFRIYENLNEWLIEKDYVEELDVEEE